MIVVTRSTAASSSRGSVIAWVTPSSSSGESASIAVGIVSRTRATREAFTLVSETQACVASSEERVTLFAGMTAAGDTLEGRVVPLVEGRDSPWLAERAW